MVFILPLIFLIPTLIFNIYINIFLNCKEICFIYLSFLNHISFSFSLLLFNIEFFSFNSFTLEQFIKGFILRATQFNFFFQFKIVLVCYKRIFVLNRSTADFIINGIVQMTRGKKTADIPRISRSMLACNSFNVVGFLPQTRDFNQGLVT